MLRKPVTIFESVKRTRKQKTHVGEIAWKRRMGRGLFATIALLAMVSASSWAQDIQTTYNRDAMEQALETRERYDVHGLRFATSTSNLSAGTEAILDDIATALQNFPEWGLRIVGHTDASGNAETNHQLSFARAEAIKAALVERGIDAGKLHVAGVGDTMPVASNESSIGRALNRRVEFVRTTDSAEAKKLLKAMTDYLASQQSVSFSYDSNLQVVTNTDQKLALASSGTVIVNRPDKVHTSRSGGFVDSEALFDGKTLTLLGKNVNKYTQVEISGTVDQLIDQLKDKFGLPLPAADLLMTTAYDELMRGVYDSKDLGSGVVNGTECDSLAFRKDDVDFQIWIAVGAEPFPCRLVITSSQVRGEPEYSVQVSNWKSGDSVVLSDFRFKNSTNAEMIDVSELRQLLSDLPENFVVGGRK